MAIALAAAVLVLPAAARAELDVRLSGNSQALWLTAWDSKGATLNVQLRSKEVWAKVGERKTAVSAQCVTEDALHLFMAEGAHLVCDAQLKSIQVGLWLPQWTHARPLAAAGSSPGVEDRPILYLMLDMEEAPPSAAPGASAKLAKPAREAEPEEPAASEQARESGVVVRGPVIYALQDQQWRRVSSYPVGLLPSDTSYHMVTVGQALYVLACSPEGQPLRLVAWRNNQWVEIWEAANIHWLRETGRVLTLLAVSDRLYLAGTTHTESGTSLAMWRLHDEGGIAEPVMIQPGKDVKISSEAPPAFATYGANVAVAYLTDKTWNVVTVDLGGGVLNVGPVDLAGGPKGTQRALQMYQVVLMALAVLLIIVSFYRQREAITKPFILPPQLVPALWVKRLLAAGLEFMAFCGPLFSVFGASSLTEEQMNRILADWQQGALWMPGLLAYMVSLSLYVLYSIIMEHVFGATLAKMLFNLRVVGAGGQRPSLTAIALRNVSKIVELNAQILMVVFLVWPLFTRYRQRFGDMIARTAVVDRRLRADFIFPSEPPTPRGPEEGPPELPPSGPSSTKKGKDEDER